MSVCACGVCVKTFISSSQKEKDELYDKIKDIKKSDYRMIVAKTDFLKRLPSEKDYYKEFETVFNKCLKS